MQELAPAQPVVSPEQIVAQYGQAIDEILKAAKDPAFEFERLVQLRKARYNWRMVKGDQFIAPGFTADWAGSEIVDYVTVDSFPSEDETGSQVAFAYPVNVLGGDLWKFVAVMGQSAPRVKAVADDPEAENALQLSRDADAVLRDCRVKQKWDTLARVLAFHQYVTGPAFAYTPFVTDPVKYGSTAEPQVQIEEQPQADGTTLPLPVAGQPKSYANGDVELFLESILTVSVPFGAKKLEDCGWLDYQYMESKWKLLAAFPKDLDEYRDADPPDDDNDSSSVSAAEANDSVGNPSGQGRPKRNDQWRYRMVWVQPFLYEAITDSNARQVFQRQFPDGLKVVRIGSKTIASGLKNEKLTDVWAVCRTGRGEKILEDPLCTDSVPIQRCLNDLINLAIETVLRSIAQTIVDQMLLDRDSVSKKEALPAEIIFTTTPMGRNISEMIAQIPPARVSDQLVPLFNALRTLQQDIIGIRPELSGGGQPTSTFREAKQRKDQALMQLSPQSQEQAAFWETVARNTVKQRARYGSGTVKVQKRSAFGTQTDAVDLANLDESGWHTEADDGIPMSFTDVADRFFSLLKEYPPEVQQALGILDAVNLDQNLELLQLPDHDSPYTAQKKKSLDDVQQLLAGQPIPGPDGKPQPSVPVDSFDDHQFVALFLARWLVANGAMRQQNPGGFENVIAFQGAHQALATPPAPPPPPLVKASLSMTSKAEDMTPAVVNEFLQAAGMGAVPQPQLPPEPPPPKVPQAKPSQTNPLPPLPPGGAMGPA